MKRVVSWYLAPKPQEISEHDLLIFTACDSAYFEYALSLARSLDFFSPGAIILIHLINPEKALLNSVDQLKAALSFTRLFVSIEKTNLSFLPEVFHKTYFACARFLRIPELLKQLPCEFLMVDSDSLVVNPVDWDFTNKDEADICLIRRDLNGPVDVRLAVATGTI